MRAALMDRDVQLCRGQGEAGVGASERGSRLERAWSVKSEGSCALWGGPARAAVRQSVHGSSGTESRAASWGPALGHVEPGAAARGSPLACLPLSGTEVWLSAPCSASLILRRCGWATEGRTWRTGAAPRTSSQWRARVGRRRLRRQRPLTSSTQICIAQGLLLHPGFSRGVFSSAPRGAHRGFA